MERTVSGIYWLRLNVFSQWWVCMYISASLLIDRITSHLHFGIPKSEPVDILKTLHQVTNYGDFIGQ